MKPIVLILTGTEAAGKSSLANKLVSDLSAVHVQAVTTRQPRNDDNGHYKYLTSDAFTSAETDGLLAISSTYRGFQYGILKSDLVTAPTSLAIVSITPQSVAEFEAINGSKFDLVSVFLDAPDDELDRRLLDRNPAVAPNHSRRADDRVDDPATTYRFFGGSVEGRAQALSTITANRGRSGILPHQWISQYLQAGALLGNATPENIQGASYDLRLGDEYYYGGLIRTLSKRKPILTIEPYDYAIVTSMERADMPRDISGRFDLSVGLFSQGVILSNGPQIDPGFRGNLFCLLFNTSSSPVLLRRGQHYATLEFHRLLEPTRQPYVGARQGKESILDYLPANAARGAINELKKEIEQLSKDSSRLQTFFIGALSLMFAVAALLIATR